MITKIIKKFRISLLYYYYYYFLELQNKDWHYIVIKNRKMTERPEKLSR